MPLSYRWYINKKPVGTQYIIKLESGSLYIMSEKATGHDWKQTVRKDWKKRGIPYDNRFLPTLRHAAGSESFLKGLPQ